MVRMREIQARRSSSSAKQSVIAIGDKILSCCCESSSSFIGNSILHYFTNTKKQLLLLERIGKSGKQSYTTTPTVNSQSTTYPWDQCGFDFKQFR